MIDDFIIETSDSVAGHNDWDKYYLYFQGNKKRWFTNLSWICTYKKIHKFLIAFPPFMPRIEWQINATYVLEYKLWLSIHYVWFTILYDELINSGRNE